MARFMTPEEAERIEQAEGFERGDVEDIVNAYFTRVLGGPLEMFESANPGVIAFERPDSFKVDWDEVAADIVRSTGIGVEVVASADWTFDDRPDEEAIYISCAIPSLPADYSSAENAYRNYIEPMDKHAVPSSDDFERARSARIFAKAHINELKARAEYATGAELEQATTNKAFLEGAVGSISARNMPLVEALLERDLEGARALIAADAASPTPTR